MCVAVCMSVLELCIKGTHLGADKSPLNKWERWKFGCRALGSCDQRVKIPKDVLEGIIQQVARADCPFLTVKSAGSWAKKVCVSPVLREHPGQQGRRKEVIVSTSFPGIHQTGWVQKQNKVYEHPASEYF